jgi:hypothetical protein
LQGCLDMVKTILLYTAEVVSNVNMANAKIIELNIKNDSASWLDYHPIKSDIKLYSSDFTLVDNEGYVLETDGRTEIGDRELANRRQKVITLVFIDENNEIDIYNELELNIGDNTKVIKLPEAEVLTTDAELLQEALFGFGDNQKKAMEELRLRISSEIITGE